MFIFRLFEFDKRKFFLTMDRTNWKWGKSNTNILFLGIAYKGISIPICWIILNHQGNSNTKQRIAIIKRFIDKFGDKNILGLLADREFVGKDWLKWLDSNKIKFFIRVKQNIITTNSSGSKTDIAG